MIVTARGISTKLNRRRGCSDTAKRSSFAPNNRANKEGKKNISRVINAAPPSTFLKILSNSRFIPFQSRSP